MAVLESVFKLEFWKNEVMSEEEAGLGSDLTVTSQEGVEIWCSVPEVQSSEELGKCQNFLTYKQMPAINCH